jgi:beta-glucosidase
MTIGATFDEDAALQWGEAMYVCFCSKTNLVSAPGIIRNSHRGIEFYNKGSNVQLGPGLCLARVPRNGRNFEYISGEGILL